MDAATAATTAAAVGAAAALAYGFGKASSAAKSVSNRPQNVGILAMEAYFPRNCLAQTALEAADGCEGKYTVGLGQESLGYFDDREDVASILLTALTRLLESYDIKPEQIGRLEVGTETLIDKSKSVKTTLLAQLFGPNADVEGVTSTNACYGGTAALLNSVAWVESSAWDGRYAVVVCGDIAVYAPGPARPTGGGGAVAMLIGPDAPLALTGPRCTHASEVYDFYKPKGDTEYATVDGKLSQEAYLTAVDQCYAGLQAKRATAMAASGAMDASPSLDDFGFACLHSPYAKLVQKGFARMLNADLIAAPSQAEWAADAEAQKWAQVPPAESVNDRDAEKVLRCLSAARYDAMCVPASGVSTRVGNCYTAAVYMNLLALVSSRTAELAGTRVLMFSYGSGAVATAFVLQARSPSGHNSLSAGGAPFTLERIARAAGVFRRLSERTERSTTEFGAAMDLRASRYGQAGYSPAGAISELFSGTYYLVEVDAQHRRSYARKP
mmetsp:Transcript_7260/g.18999  ORF Transcript_7260/g.18999 Transcript_7260/m.18999 type:complete len:498 (-) Transcript_7260:309-1802(-)